MSERARPTIAITMGDPAGVGPETIVGAWSSPALHASGRPFVVGHPQILRQAAELLKLRVRVVEISSPEEARPAPDLVPCLSAVGDDALTAPRGKDDARGGQAAYEALVAAARLAISGQVDAITTAPLSKAALHAAGHHYPGHTELLAELCGLPAREVAMMLYLAPGETVLGPAGLGVAHVTLHTALRKVFGLLDEARIESSALLADAVMRALLPAGSGQPRIGVAALNPHAGEHGLFGDEEERIISPAIERGRALGLNLTGPLPCDTLMVRAAAGEFDAVVAMYHDQGHIALKLLGMHRAVNITLGLPIIRTSVAHGTAYDLAWQGKAGTSSMIEAVRVAALLARRRAELPTKP